MPASFPAVRVGWTWVPVIHFSAGRLEISGSGLQFSAIPRDSYRYRGLRDDLRFTLAVGEIKAVQWAQAETVAIRYYTPPFIRADPQLLGRGTVVVHRLAQPGDGRLARQVEVNSLVQRRT